ncbi:hypothetical protein [Neobacillus niacini]|nr:hypothetical protein [Neobacillus niacini]
MINIDKMLIVTKNIGKASVYQWVYNKVGETFVAQLLIPILDPQN